MGEEGEMEGERVVGGQREEGARGRGRGGEDFNVHHFTI